MKYLLIIVIMSFSLGQANAQTSWDPGPWKPAKDPIYIYENKTCPDFIIRNVEYYPKKQVKISDFRGKWLILDFWNKGCSGCIASFPELNQIQKQFAGKAQLIQIGYEDWKNEIRPLYHKLHDRLHLELPCSFDSTLMNKLDIYSSPHTVFIDPQGIVRGVTTYFTTENVAEFIKGGKPTLEKTYWRLHEHLPGTTVETYKPLLTNNNGGSDTDFLYRSLLTKWNPAFGQHANWGEISDKLGNYKHYSFQPVGVSLAMLYSFVYWDQLMDQKHNDTVKLIWPAFILETRDTNLFRADWKSSGKNMFSYSLIVPPEKFKKEILRRMMARDLKNWFGYEVIQEERKMPCWVLRATDSARGKLKTKGGQQKVTSNHFAMTYQNYPVMKALNETAPKMPVSYKIFTETSKMFQWPCIDETGINSNIDITLDTGDKLNTDEAAITEALKANGLYWVKSERMMKVLVIEDPKPDETTDLPGLIIKTKIDQ